MGKLGAGGKTRTQREDQDLEDGGMDAMGAQVTSVHNQESFQLPWPPEENQGLTGGKWLQKI